MGTTAVDLLTPSALKRCRWGLNTTPIPPVLTSQWYFFQHYYCYYFLIFRATSVAYGVPQAKGLIGAAAASLCHSHSNKGSKPSVTYTTAHGNAGSLTY